MKNTVWKGAGQLGALALLLAGVATCVQAEGGNRAKEDISKEYPGIKVAQERDGRGTRRVGEHNRDRERREHEKRRPEVEVTLDAPVAGTVFTAPATIELTASASVDRRRWEIVRVEFYANGELLSSSTSAPYSVTWAGVGAGSYTLIAKAYATNPGQARAEDREHARRDKDEREKHRPVWVGSSEPIKVTVAANVAKALYFIQVDHLATPRLVADENQKTVWRWDNQEPFGDNPANEDPDGDGVAFDFPMRFPGQYYDRESGLHYNYFRDYDPSVGRYVESDPIGLRGGPNTFSYAISDPLRRADPTGLTVFLFSTTVGGGVSASAFGGQVFNLQVSDPVAGQTCNYTVACIGVGFGVRGSISGGSGTVRWDDGKMCSNCRQFEGDGSMGVVAVQAGPIGYTPVQWLQVPGGPRLDFSGWAVAEVNIGGGTYACRFYLR